MTPTNNFTQDEGGQLTSYVFFPKKKKETHIGW